MDDENVPCTHGRHRFSQNRACSVGSGKGMVDIDVLGYPEGGQAVPWAVKPCSFVDTRVYPTFIQCCSYAPVTVHFIVRVLRTSMLPAHAYATDRVGGCTLRDRLTGLHIALLEDLDDLTRLAV